ncbi:unnamed protein product [Lepeophtheirus salmonis]|uniref:(salmon louse) hypothetical protein n=1 Tax=Lepeophtheirus salmonis TaxID=72036 RepID=A0A7R8D306_LEPSM|nr:unnamed protein product [Lepeophtheirus salmonis]CAF3008142.1 unnamed protein product [Lepeophtheirus salmonis]
MKIVSIWLTNIRQLSKFLKTSLLRRKMKMVARHLLATRPQGVGKTLDTYFQTLQFLSRDYSFSRVNAEKNRCDYVRDSYINALASHEKRRRLLENFDFQMMEVFDQAKSLELVQKQADFCRNSRMTPLNTTTVSVAEDQNEVLADSSSNSKCYFFGFGYHTRQNYPARNRECRKCNKKGYIIKVCHFSSSNNTVSTSVLLKNIIINEQELASKIKEYCGTGNMGQQVV